MILLANRSLRPMRASEWVSAMILTSFGIVLLQPPSTFGLVPIYGALQNIASEDQWGLLCFIAGTFRLAILAGSSMRQNMALRGLSAFISAFFFFQISLGVVLGPTGTASTAVAVYPWLTILDLTLLYRAARDRRIIQAAFSE